MEKWFKAHNFPYIKMENGTYFWQTCACTGKLTTNNEWSWYAREYFDEVKTTAKNIVEKWSPHEKADI